jgi:CubicO group peptidase (beta-lactamase class C family)
MGLAVFCAGRPVLLAGYGDADADTPFRWGSITKSFTGLAALRLMAEGDLSPASPVRPILGDGFFHNAWASTHPIRVGDLLSLTAGLADLSRAEWQDNEPRGLWQALEIHDADRRTLWPPGLQHSYSNVPPGLTAAVIERASGRSFDDYLRSSILVPLGMDGASLGPVAGLPGGFRADGETTIPYWHVTFRAFGALNASTREMSRFLSALLNGGVLDGEQVIPAALIEPFFAPGGTLGSRAGLQVGYGAGIYGWIRHGQLFHGHGGDADGYRSRYGLLREHGRAYLVVINTDNPTLLGRMRRVLEQALAADLPPPEGPGSGRDDLEIYAGTYYPSSARFDPEAWIAGRRDPATIRHRPDRLLFSRGKETLTLYPAGGGRFFRSGDPVITAVFARDAAGSLYLQGEPGNFVRISPGPCPDFLPFCD